MAFGQMYYTSCRTGLSGAPGFQFNAVSPGIGPDVLRAAEELTSYQPPRELTLTPSDENVRRAPVNLCYLPGPVALLANVVYLGTDYSRRPGNYFAHTLVSRDPGHDLHAPLPIELWRAPFWARREVASTDLPELRGPLSPGPLDRAAVAAFLRERPGARHLPALLTAGDDTIRNGRRKVVVVGRDSDEVAHWIAALCYLLPPGTAARMSFATYDRDPRYSRVDVIGAVSGGDLDLTEQDFASYHLFDFAAGRVSDLDPHPLAGILAGLDAADAQAAWSRVAGLATGEEQSFDDWLPVVAAALMTWPRGPESARDEPVAVAAWLAAQGARLGPATVEEIGRAVLALLAADAGGSAVPAMCDLATAAARGRVPDLLEAAETRIVDVLLTRARDGCPPDDLAGVALTTAAGRRHATDRLSAELPNLPAPAMLALLAWCAAAGLEPDPAALHQAGERVVGPAVLARPADPRLREVLTRLPRIRAGVVRYLDAVAGDELDRLVIALGEGLEDLLGPGLADAGPGVRRALTVTRVRSGRLDPVEGLKTVLTDEQAGREPPGDRLLALLFDGPWSPEQARRVLAVLGTDRATAAPVLRRLSESVLGPYEREVAPLAGLCAELKTSPLYARIDERARGRVDVLTSVDKWAAHLAGRRKDGADLVEARRKWFAALPAEDRRMAEALLLDRLDGLRARARALLVVALPGLRRAYCADLASRLSRRGGELDPAAKGLLTFANVVTLQPTPAVRAAVAELDAVLRRSVGRWNGRARARLVEFIALDARPDTVAWIEHWLEQRPPGLAGRVRGLWGRPGRDAKAKGRDR